MKDGVGAGHEAPRRLGFWDVVGLGINCVIGSGIFLLPGLVAERVGPASIVAVGVAGILAGLVALCFAEASSRFDGSGGAYLYAREAFGPLVGFEVGWISALAGVVAWAALLAAWPEVLSRLWPGLDAGAPRVLTILLFAGALGTLNALGAKLGAAASNLASVAKLLALVGFLAAGLFYIEAPRFVPFAPLGFERFGEAVLLFLYAYVGFENLVVPAGEMRDPRRNVPRAVALVLAVVTVLYVAVQTVTQGTLDNLPGLRNAVAVATEGFLGPVGGTAIALVIAVSILGVNAASSLILPRRVSAMAERGELPPLLGRVHVRFGTPTASVVLVHVLAAGVALTGSFEDLVVLAVVGRLMQYVPTCLAVLTLRRREERAGFSLPGGPFIPALALGLCGWLLLTAKPAQLLIGAAAAVAGLPVWWWMRRRTG